MSPRTLVIGLDACSPVLVRRFVAEGHLPTLGRLLGRSARATLEHEAGYFVGSAWPTMMTGLPVTEHGWYSGTRWLPEAGHYVLHPLTTDPFWAWGHRAGRRAVVLDVPHFPAAELDGAQLVEWGCHDRFFGPGTWPRELLTDLIGEFGEHPIGCFPEGDDPRFAPCDWVHRDHIRSTRTSGQTRALLDALTDGVERKTELSLALLRRTRPDLFVTVFGESHCVGHHLWHLHDPSHPRHDPELRRELGGDPLLHVYRLLDRSVARLIAEATPDTAVYVLLSHGMQAHYDGTHLLPELLHRLDLAHRGEDVPTRGWRTRAAAALAGPASSPVRRAADAALRAQASRRLRDRVGVTTTQLPPIGERSWFMLDNNTVTASVRLNLRGREQPGAVPADRIDEVLRWLAAELGRVTNVDTGRPVFESVYRSGEVHGHGSTHDLADLLIEWERSGPIERVWSPSIGLVHVPDPEVRSGDHDRFGLLLASGPGIAACDLEISPLDVAPTLLASLGVGAPSAMHPPVAALTCR